MSIHFGIYLTGPFGQSQQLYQVRNEAKRNRGSWEKVEEQIKKDTAFVLGKQQEAGVSFLCDPLFSQYYLFQPFVEHMHNVSAGPQENWFNNNVFYRRPQINASAYRDTALLFIRSFTQKYHRGKSDLAILPSPFTLMVLSDLFGFENLPNHLDKRTDTIIKLSWILRNEAVLLTQEGYSRIQYDEPAIVYKQSLGSLKPADVELLRVGLKICGQIPKAKTILQTYFGDAGPLLSQLASLPVDGIGVDATETKLEDILACSFVNKELALGLVDARSTALENPNELAAKLHLVEESCRPKALYLTPNTGTEYRGWTHGLRKLQLLAEVRKIYDQEKP